MLIYRTEKENFFLGHDQPGSRVCHAGALLLSSIESRTPRHQDRIFHHHQQLAGLGHWPFPNQVKSWLLNSFFSSPTSLKVCIHVVLGPVLGSAQLQKKEF